ncbi:MAG: PP2C family protein-serine/threonine phosphatase [Lachnospiraceae bacterium]|nr:PP2C family protein-serine/threonine phosphatase [bacterium]MDY5517415.1 PP2C family protein-serine/threonine phosphatase [Lachnospiraceae bacterium]
MKKQWKMSLNVKMILMVGFLAVVVTTVAALISYRVYSSAFDSYYQSMAKSQADAQAAMLDERDVAEIQAAVKSCYGQVTGELGTDFDHYSDEDWAQYYDAFASVKELDSYHMIHDTQQELAESFGVESIYICYLDLDWDCAMYLVDGSISAEPCEPGVFDAPIIPEVRACIENGTYDFPAYITNYDEYGWLCTAAAPVLSEDGALLAVAYVDVSMNDVMESKAAFLRLLVGVLTAIETVLIVLWYMFISRMIVKPVNRLAAATASFVEDRERQGSEGAVSAISQLDIHTGDEIEHLSDAVRTMEKQINDYIDHLTAITAEKERIGAELNVATQIQADMLPSIFPAFPERRDLDIYASMNPAKEVGGDFYDFFLINENKLAIVMADVSGKGVPAALFMVIAKTLIKNQAMMDLPPEVVLEHVNNQLCEGNQENFFVTAWLGIVDMNTGVMDYANAGHNPPILIHPDGSMEWMKNISGLVLAAMEGLPYTPHRQQLQHGDRIYLYTDGVTEAINKNEEAFGEKRLQEALERMQGNAVCESISGVRMSLNQFVGEVDQFDDITMLEFEYK